MLRLRPSLARAGLLRRTWLVALVDAWSCARASPRTAIAALRRGRYLRADAPREPRPPVAAAADHAAAPGSPTAPRSSRGTCSARRARRGQSQAADARRARVRGAAAVLIATSLGADPRAHRARARRPRSRAAGASAIGSRRRHDRADRRRLDRCRRRRGPAHDDLAPRDQGRRARCTRCGNTRAARGPADPFADRIRKIDDATYEVDRALVRELVSGATKPGRRAHVADHQGRRGPGRPPARRRRGLDRRPRSACATPT